MAMLQGNKSQFSEIVENTNAIGWGTWIRTKINGVRVRCSTIELSPKKPKHIQQLGLLVPQTSKRFCKSLQCGRLSRLSVQGCQYFPRRQAPRTQDVPARSRQGR